MQYTVFVPTDTQKAPPSVLPGAALLCPGQAARGAQTLRVLLGHGHGPFAENCRAAERGRQLTVPRSDMECVGWWDSFAGELRADPRQRNALERWVGRRVFRGDLVARDNRQDRRRDARNAFLRGDLRTAHRLDPGRLGF